MSSTTASSLAGAWLGELAAAAQGGWQAVAPGHGGQQQRRKLRAGPGEQRHEAPAVGGAAAGDGDVGRYGGAMSDTTVYLLLDRFAPS